MREDSPKFIQIATSWCPSTEETAIYVLDEAGDVWFWDPDNNGWSRLPDTRLPT